VSQPGHKTTAASSSINAANASRNCSASVDVAVTATTKSASRAQAPTAKGVA
jgi:hypothetical protein